MEWNRLVFLGFNILMAVALLGVIVYVYRPSRKHEMEEPKYRILDED